MDSTDKMDPPFVRNLDKTTASMTVVDLNNLVVSLRPAVRKAKVAVVHKLVRQMKRLRKLKGTDEQVTANKGKADRYGLEVDALKKLNIDLLVKNALKNTNPIKDIGKLPDAESRILLRIACQKSMTDNVEKWRSHHDDWKSLAAYLWSKNSGRRYKTTKESDETEKKCKTNRKKDKPKPWEKDKRDLVKKETESQSGPVNIPCQKKNSAATEESESNSDSPSEVLVLTKKIQSGNNSAQKVKNAKSAVHEVPTTLKKVVSDSGSEDSDSYSEEDTICADPTTRDSSSELGEDQQTKGLNTGETISKTDESSETSEDELSGNVTGDKDTGDDESDSSDDNGSEESDSSNHSNSEVQSTLCKQNKSSKNVSTQQQPPEMVVKRLTLDSQDDSSEVDTQNRDDLPFLFRTDIRPESKPEKPASTAPKKKRDSFFYGGSDTDDSDSSTSTDNEENPDSDNDNPVVRQQQESTFVGLLSGRVASRGRFSSDYQNKRGRPQNRGTGGFRGGHTSRGRGQSERRGERHNSYDQRGHLDRNRGASSHSNHPGNRQIGDSSDNRLGARHTRSQANIRIENRSTDSRKRLAESSSEVIHPSWAASKKRKEQQATIQAFQGKKTIFSDDD